MKRLSKYELIYTFDEFIDGFEFNKSEIDLIRKAYDIAEESLENMRRISKSPFFSHVLFVGRKLYDLRMDPFSIIIGLLHHSYYGKYISQINRAFPKKLVDQLKLFSRISMLKKAAREYKFNYANMRNLLIALSNDVRIIVVELVNKYHNVLTSKLVSDKEKMRDAVESLEIYSVLAQKYGLGELSTGFEDYALKVLFPKRFNELKVRINQTRDERKRRVSQIMYDIDNALKQAGLSVTVTGRAKHFYSILKKIEKKGKKLDEIYDLFAVRVITHSVADCYKVLDIIHSNYEPMPNRLKDYITHPKRNGYQSIHTTVRKGDLIFEVQIRTREMHIAAELGLAAHWKYKNFDISKFDKYIELSKQSLEVLRELDPRKKSLIDSANIELFGDHFFVFTPKGDPIQMPIGSTIVDFAFRIHSYLGFHITYARVNNLKKPITYKLIPADIIEIISSPNVQAKEKWLSIASTKDAKYKLRNYFGLALKPNLKSGVEQKHYGLIDFDEKYTIAGCCRDIKYGDDIVAVKTKSGWVVHKKNCQNVSSLRVVRPVGWKKIPLEIRVLYSNDDKGVLLKILTKINEHNVKIFRINAENSRENYSILSIIIEPIDKKQLERLSRSLTSSSNAIKDIQIKEKFDAF
ncbi:MAG: HD domain-containing protein [Nitrospiraceae bacterium]|nr:HD domain-containing protein [Nitrospiraceae bacterium]